MRSVCSLRIPRPARDRGAPYARGRAGPCAVPPPIRDPPLLPSAPRLPPPCLPVPTCPAPRFVPPAPAPGSFLRPRSRRRPAVAVTRGLSARPAASAPAEGGTPPRRDRVGPNRSTHEWNFCCFAKGNPERVENKGVSTLQPALLGREQRVLGRFCGFCRELQSVPRGSAGSLRCTEFPKPPSPAHPRGRSPPPQLLALILAAPVGTGGRWHMAEVLPSIGVHGGSKMEIPRVSGKGPNLVGTTRGCSRAHQSSQGHEQSSALGVPCRTGAAGIRPQAPGARRLWLASTAAPRTASCCAVAQTCLAMHACVPGAAADTSPARRQDEPLCHQRAELAALLPRGWKQELGSEDLRLAAGAWELGHNEGHVGLHVRKGSSWILGRISSPKSSWNWHSCPGGGGVTVPRGVQGPWGCGMENVLSRHGGGGGLDFHKVFSNPPFSMTPPSQWDCDHSQTAGSSGKAEDSGDTEHSPGAFCLLVGGGAAGRDGKEQRGTGQGLHVSTHPTSSIPAAPRPRIPSQPPSRDRSQQNGKESKGPRCSQGCSGREVKALLTGRRVGARACLDAQLTAVTALGVSTLSGE